MASKFPMFSFYASLFCSIKLTYAELAKIPLSQNTNKYNYTKCLSNLGFCWQQLKRSINWCHGIFCRSPKVIEAYAWQNTYRQHENKLRTPINFFTYKAKCLTSSPLSTFSSSFFLTYYQNVLGTSLLEELSSVLPHQITQV